MTTHSFPIRILPVVDLLGGVVVRGQAGQRSEYRPIRSQLVSEPAPAAIAAAFVRLGFREVYVADLDAIMGGQPSWRDYATIAAAGLRPMIDAAVTDVVRAEQIIAPGYDVIVGLETLPRIELLAELVTATGADRLVFSLDLQAGQPLCRHPDLRGLSAREIAAAALRQGIRRMIVLDLAQVGMYGGLAEGTASLCRWLREDHPDLELISGGGVRDRGDLARLAQAGCDAALVASALHDGRLLDG